MGIFSKTADYLKERLGKTRSKISSSLTSVLSIGRKIDDDLLDELEETLISDDIGVETTDKLITELRDAYRSRQISNSEDVIPFLKEHIKSYWPDRDRQLHVAETGPTVILVAGVNGTGKTTSIAKLAHIFKRNGKTVIVAACDTFRAAAVEQLTEWAERVGCDIVKQEQGGDPAAVVYDGLAAARSRGADVVLIDTAGRLHTQVNLMRELEKVHRVIRGNVPGAPHETLLVIDATTGQNGLRQAQEFQQAVDVNGVVLTKLDGTAKGGIVVAIHQILAIPIKLVGVGERLEDLRPFEPDIFARAVFGGAPDDEESA